MSLTFKPISHSWVASHPKPKGVVEFLGGALYGSVPNVSYGHFLRSLYEAGYTVITLPFRFGLNHTSIAESLLVERDEVLRQIGNAHQGIPRFWVGHSLGCKYIVLLEAAKKILDQPSLLIAPDISDTADAIPIPPVAGFLNWIGRGVKPDRDETHKLLQEKNSLFNLTALISFENDTVAGNQKGLPDQPDEPPSKSDVFLFIQELDGKDGLQLIKKEIPGKHTEIVGIRVYSSDSTFSFVDLDLTDAIFEDPRRRLLEPLAVQCLKELEERLKVVSGSKFVELNQVGLTRLGSKKLTNPL